MAERPAVRVLSFVCCSQVAAAALAAQLPMPLPYARHINFFGGMVALVFPGARAGPSAGWAPLHLNGGRGFGHSPRRLKLATCHLDANPSCCHPPSSFPGGMRVRIPERLPG